MIVEPVGSVDEDDMTVETAGDESEFESAEYELAR